MGYDMSMVGTIPGEDEEMAAIEPLWRAALEARDVLGREAAGTYQPDVDTEGAGWEHPYANATPEYKAAQAEVLRLSDLRDRANRSYFRLNVWGMARYRDVMEAVGMGHWSDQPDWPKVEDFNVTRDQVWALNRHDEVEDEAAWDAMDDTTRDRVVKFHEANKAVLSAHPGETRGIPLWKFGSNDGWHVTPVECSSALQAFGEWLVHGLDGLSWQDALDGFRKAPQDERRVIIANAADRHDMAPQPVGHAPFAGEADDRKSQLDVLVEDYWLQWLQYLTDGVHAGGFEVY